MVFLWKLCKFELYEIGHMKLVSDVTKLIYCNKMTAYNNPQ